MLKCIIFNKLSDDWIITHSGQIVGERGGTAFLIARARSAEQGNGVPLPFLAGERRSPSLHGRCGWTQEETVQAPWIRR